MSNLIKVDRASELHVTPFEAEEYPCDSHPSCGRTGTGKVILPAGDRGASGREDLSEQSLQDRVAAAEKEGYEKGFEQGHKDGLHLARKRLEDTIGKMIRLCEELAGLKAQIYREAERELLSLAMLAARKVLQAEVKADPDTVLRTLRACLEQLGDQSRVRVVLNPQDLEVVQAHLPRLTERSGVDRYEVVQDPAIQRGGCILETGFGRINGSLADQLLRIEKELEREFETIHGGCGAAAEPVCDDS
ncbi:MAG: hypothetical protein JRF59_04855 [Deltaproteobacteria bacterium]|nr:hypothetical protein [Deltaproteobacteria bacterium]MBW1924614.1 hypothetical protein [Deltaproteobacteria bacterium]MBW1949128.1 hypothetical protein [Deltaproteobacteria bacterium]MBW2007417.1 hypothetical protein [Deltaproteobacteria bacterium]MBW2101288.1 hypothetical protein [Deltaproteobacteria bacterium]